MIVRSATYAWGDTICQRGPNSRPLELPDIAEYAVKVDMPGGTSAEQTRMLGGWLCDVIADNEPHHNFRLVGPARPSRTDWRRVRGHRRPKLVAVGAEDRQAPPDPVRGDRDRPRPAGSGVQSGDCYAAAGRTVPPCQNACNRARLDEAIGINAVERFLGDLALHHGWTVPVAPPTGRRILVVGAGPAGLTAAYQLARRGHAVTLREAAPHAGGMLTYESGRT
jgi:hypothetical protein